MMIKRAGFAAIAVILSVSMMGCATPASEDGARASDEPTSSPDDKGAQQEGFFPDEPTVAIDWENTVVDVEPVSRFRTPPGGPDIAHFQTTLGLEEEPDDETQDFFKGLDDVEVEFDGRLVRMTYEMEVDEIDENRYKFEFDVPVSFADLDKNDDVSAVVLLPRDAEEYENVPSYQVQLDEEFEETAPDNVVVTEAEDAPGNRITIGLYERTDPKLPPIFNYLP
jgi:hypothetical protein